MLGGFIEVNGKITDGKEKLKIQEDVKKFFEEEEKY